MSKCKTILKTGKNSAWSRCGDDKTWSTIWFKEGVREASLFSVR